MKGQNELQTVKIVMGVIGFIITVIGGFILGATIMNPNMLGIELIIIGVAIIGIMSSLK